MPYEKIGKNEPVCIADEVPFEIPESWEWCRLIDLYNFIDYRGATPNKISSGVPLITAKNVKSGYIDYSIKDFISYEEYLNRQSRGISRRGDILFTTEAPMGNVALADLDTFSAGQRLITLQQYTKEVLLSNKLIVFFIMSAFFQDQLKQHCTGTTVKGIKAEKLKRFLIPVPPQNEQARILDKIAAVNPYIGQCSESEGSLNTLNREFPESLKKSILHQAIMGKLVPQNENDEPASILLDRIRAEKQELINAGKLKKDKHESVIYRRDNSHYERLDGVERCIDDEIPFEIPASWTWCRIKDIVIKEIKRGKSPQYANSGRNYVFAQKCNVKAGGIDMSLAKFLSDVAFEKYPSDEYMLDEDIIINSTGNGTLGRIGIFHDTDRIGAGEIVPDSHVTVIRKSTHISTMYAFYVLKYYQPYLEKQGEGSTNQTELKPAIISDLLFPLPPYNEQLYIAEKVTQSFTSMTALT